MPVCPWMSITFEEGNTGGLSLEFVWSLHRVDLTSYAANLPLISNTYFKSIAYTPLPHCNPSNHFAQGRGMAIHPSATQQCPLIKLAADSHTHLLHPSSIFSVSIHSSISLDLTLVPPCDVWSPALLHLCDYYLSESAAGAALWWTSRNRIKVTALRQLWQTVRSKYLVHLYTMPVSLLNCHICNKVNHCLINNTELSVFFFFPLAAVSVFKFTF